jgi:hydroxyacylglutathione hydrolase
VARLVVEIFPCRSDNYGVLVHDPDSGETASIDAPEEGPILRALEETGWRLTHILTTHRHDDHVAANEALKRRFDCRIIGPEAEADAIPGIDQTVKEGEPLQILGRTVEIIATPGHTKGHIAYNIPDEELAFVGDTLFVMGCGRVFEGTMEEMWNSLQKLAALDHQTRIYCGHEYTLANARFAVTVDPENERLRGRLADMENLRQQNMHTVPTTLALELATNPFLRADDPSVKHHMRMDDAPAAEVFAAMRKRKDAF